MTAAGRLLKFAKPGQAAGNRAFMDYPDRPHPAIRALALTSSLPAIPVRNGVSHTSAHLRCPTNVEVNCRRELAANWNSHVWFTRVAAWRDP